MDVLIDQFLTSRELTCTSATIALYRHILVDYRSHADSINEELINTYLRHLKRRGLAQDTVRNAYRIIKTACRWWFDHGSIDHNPFEGPRRVRAPTLRRRRRTTYTDLDIQRLLSAPPPKAANKRRNDLQRQRWTPGGALDREELQARCLVLLLADSGMRAGEIARLNCGDIRSNYLIIMGKGEQQDVAYISTFVRSELLQLVADRANSDPLFRDHHGQRATPRALRTLLRRLAARAGVQLPQRPLHAFRHYAARAWVKAGVNDLTIQQLMRHANLSTTQIYTNGIDPDELAKIHERASPVGAIMKRASPTGSVG